MGTESTNRGIRLADLLIVCLVILLSASNSRGEEFVRGVVERNSTPSCDLHCDDLLLRSDSGETVLKLTGALLNVGHIGQHVEVFGYKGTCGGCSNVFFVEQITILPPVGVRIADSQIPISVRLDQNVPNPFNPSTSIRYEIPTNGFVQVRVSNVLGEDVDLIISRRQAAGGHEVVWQPSSTSSGVYYYTLLFHGDNGTAVVTTKKMLYVR